MYKVTEKSTVHSNNTPHGWKTPHRFPSKTSNAKDLLDLVSQLYPTGRVWNLPEESEFSKLHIAINKSMLRLSEAIYNLIDSSFPDNVNFDELDATLWEYRLGMVTNKSLSIETRRNNVLRKLTFRNNTKARQNVKYIEYQLNQAGFDVKIYSNIFFTEEGVKYYKTPEDILGLQVSDVQHGDNTQHGSGTQHGGGNVSVIANSEEEENFGIGGDSNLWSTFFIAGSDISENALIPKSREKEFRRLVLSLKPAHLTAYTFITYI